MSEPIDCGEVSFQMSFPSSARWAELVAEYGEAFGISPQPEIPATPFEATLTCGGVTRRVMVTKMDEWGMSMYLLDEDETTPPHDELPVSS